MPGEGGGCCVVWTWGENSVWILPPGTWGSDLMRSSELEPAPNADSRAPWEGSCRGLPDSVGLSAQGAAF